MVYLRDKPEAVTSWHAGWERKLQPSFDVLVDHLVKSNDRFVSEPHRKQFAAMLHKVVHPDPAAAMWNMIEKEVPP